MWTLRELRDEVRSHLIPGMPRMNCRVCRQPVFLYLRKLNSGMAYSLVRAYRYDRDVAQGAFFHYREARLDQNLEYSKLAYWGLLEQQVSNTATGTTLRGRWRVTDKGRAFVEEEMRVPLGFYEYNRECYGFTKEKTGIRKALGNKFDLDELLKDNMPR